MRAALLFLWLITLTPFAQATDWLGWRKVGDATLTWGPFTVYTSQLRTPEGRYTGNPRPVASTGGFAAGTAERSLAANACLAVAGCRAGGAAGVRA